MTGVVTNDSKFACAEWIVSGNLSDGATHTTIAAALSTASSGDTIFIKPGTYTENLTAKAGVNLVAFPGDQLGNVSIVGKITFTSAGNFGISNIRLTTNSDFFLSVTGSAASVVVLENCYLNATNNTGIQFTSSNAGASITAMSCTGDIGTTGIAMFSSSSAGPIAFRESYISNSGSSTTASSNSAGTQAWRNSRIDGPVATTSTGTFQGTLSVFFCQNINTTAINHAGTGTNSVVQHCDVSSGTAVCITIGTGATLRIQTSNVNTSNASAITGLGTLNYGDVTFSSSSIMTTTTQNGLITRPGIWISGDQPAFLAYLNTQDNNVTGDGTAYNLGSGNALTEVFDQNSDFNTNGTFTAPYTARYKLGTSYRQTGAINQNTAVYEVVTSNRVYGLWVNTVIAEIAENVFQNGNVLCDMDAGDTATINITYGGSTKTVSIMAPTGSRLQSVYYGQLVT